MKETEIIETLRSKLAAPGGRHLYGVMGSYGDLDHFAGALQQATGPDGTPFAAPLSVNRGILMAIPDAEYLRLVEDEARKPEPTAAHVAHAFDLFLRSALKQGGLVALSELEMLFAYRIELSLLRSLAADENRILLLLPGRRESGRVIMFPDWDERGYTLPTNLIADNHLWELR